MIFIDSNVLIATLVREHIHHEPSRQLLRSCSPGSCATAAHCLSETFSQLTRTVGPFRFDPRAASEQIELIAANIRVVALSAVQTSDAIRRFAATGGAGPRLYDYLIGATGEAFGADTIVTWNVRHFEPLFPHLRIVTPDAV